jgi:hypothetical protein
MALLLSFSSGCPPSHSSLSRCRCALASLFLLTFPFDLLLCSVLLCSLASTLQRPANACATPCAHATGGMHGAEPPPSPGRLHTCAHDARHEQRPVAPSVPHNTHTRPIMRAASTQCCVPRERPSSKQHEQPQRRPIGQSDCQSHRGHKRQLASIRAPDLTVAQPSGDKHLDRLGVGAIWQIQVLAQWLG